MRFEMPTDTRARSAAKQLRKLLQHFDINFTLSQSRDVVSTMYGYEDWKDLRGQLGGSSEDDAALSEPDRDLRRQFQVNALLRSGVDQAVASQVVDRLALTRRAEYEPGGAGEIAAVSYHPVRINEAADEIYEWEMWARDRSAGHRERRDVSTGGDAEGEDDYWDEFLLGEYGSIVSEWFLDREIAPMDELCDGYHVDLDLVTLGQLAAQGRLPILDVSESLPYLVQVPAVSELPAADGTMAYIHFGVDALSSPFVGRGVEGAYVDNSRDDFMRLVLIVSQEPFSQVLEPEERYVHNTRAVEVFLDRATLGIVFGKRNGEYVDRWSEDVSTAVSTAVSALGFSLETSDEGYFAFPDATDEVVKAKFEKARSTRARDTLRRQIYEATGEIVAWKAPVRPAPKLAGIRRASETVMYLPQQHIAAMTRWSSAVDEETVSLSIVEQAIELGREAYDTIISNGGGNKRLALLERNLLELGDLRVLYAAEADVAAAEAVLDDLVENDMAHEAIVPVWRTIFAMRNGIGIDEARDELRSRCVLRSDVGLPAVAFDWWTLAIAEYLHGDREEALQVYSEAYLAFPDFHNALDMGMYAPGVISVRYSGGDWHAVARRSELLRALLPENEIVAFIDLKHEVQLKTKRDHMYEHYQANQRPPQ